jgi:hypothetical protein
MPMAAVQIVQLAAITSSLVLLLLQPVAAKMVPLPAAPGARDNAGVTLHVQRHQVSSLLQRFSAISSPSSMHAYIIASISLLQYFFRYTSVIRQNSEMVYFFCAACL